MTLSVGDEVFDEVVGGGLPENRTMMIIGDPGTGKTTLGMQFLQAGLDEGETGLFVSTEQTAEELRSAFESFDFELNHENLQIVTLHAQPGYTIESSEQRLVLTGLGGETLFETAFTPPFSIEYVERFLSQFAPVDRVVFDSVSGLVPMAESTTRLRRLLLDLVRLFGDQLEATALVTAEGRSPESVTETLEYATHGVIELRQEQVETDRARFLRVVKMRGADHDTREYGIEFTADGIRVVERYHATTTHGERVATGIDGLDRLCGGLVKAGTTVIEHDGRATLDAIFASVLADHLNRGRRAILIPPATMTYDRLAELFDREGSDLDEALAAGEVCVVDVIGVWHNDHDYVYSVTGDNETLRETLEAAASLDEQPITLVKNVVTLVNAVDPSTARELRYWVESELLQDSDVAIDVINRRAITDELAEFYVESAQQVLRTWLHRNGLQFVTLAKGRGQNVGSVRLVEFIDEPPFVYVESSGPP